MPAVSANSWPRVGNAGFAVRLMHATPGSIAVLTGNVFAAATPLGPCHLLLALPFVSLNSVLTAADGTASAPLPIPVTSSFAGMHVYAQFVVLDPNGALSGIGALSNGLEVQLGF